MTHMSRYEVPVVNGNSNTVGSEIRQHQNELVSRFEDVAISMPQVHIETTHLLHGGMYARTIRIPANTMLTGTMTSCDNICIVDGDITVTTDYGPKRLTGFNVLPATSGARRAGVTHSETHWTTIIPTCAGTVEQAEADLTAEPQRLQTNRTGIVYDEQSIDRLSYKAFREAIGMSQDMVDAIVLNESDCIVTDRCEVICRRGESKIHGIGLFATRDIEVGAIIAPGRMNGKRCVAGRWTNHSAWPNAAFVAASGDAEIEMVATNNIAEGAEITVNYGQSHELANKLEDSR
jgi:Fe-S-cluster-containing hydrogenase component 2